MKALYVFLPMLLRRMFMPSVEQSTVGRKSLALPIMVMTLLLIGCDIESGDQHGVPTKQQSAPAPSEDLSWFMRGGSLNRASTLDMWRAANTEERLASAADLLSMKVKNLPAPQEAAQMARTLEAKITAAAGVGEQGPLGPVVDRIVSEMKW
jgi:hypothetical protein